MLQRLSKTIFRKFSERISTDKAKRTDSFYAVSSFSVDGLRKIKKRIKAEKSAIMRFYGNRGRRT